MTYDSGQSPPIRPQKERFDQIENRLDCAEALLVSAGEMMLEASALARQNSEQIGLVLAADKFGSLRLKNKPRTDFDLYRSNVMV